MSYRIMIVEDEYWTAMDMAAQVRERGASVSGPLGSIAQAIEALRGGDQPDAAILDIRLRSNEVFQVADILVENEVPFVFATACPRDDLPERFASVPHFEKPFAVKACVESALELAEAHSNGRQGAVPFRNPF